MCQVTERIAFLVFTTILILFLGIQFNVFYIFQLFVETSLHDKYIGLGIFMGITFNTFFILTLYTYFKTANTSPGRPIFPKELIEDVKRKECSYEEKKNVNVNYNSMGDNKTKDEESFGQDNNTANSSMQQPFHSQQYQLAAAPQIFRQENQLQEIADDQQLSKQLYEVEELDDIHTTNPKRCLYCDSLKVIRVHHCRICGYCIFRRDHHCVWIGNCVGIKNHKFFMLFLLYAALSLFQIVVPVLCDFLKIGIDIMDPRDNIVQFVILCTSMIISGAFTISLIGLFIFQFYISTDNQTTLEMQNGIRSNEEINYSRGSTYYNLIEVFGEKFSYRWFLPVTPKFNQTYKIYCEEYEIQII